MSTVTHEPTDSAARHVDQRVTIHGATWADYERLLQLRGEASRPRLTYLEGDLELMSPSWDHEWIKSLIGRLVETYAEEQGLHLDAIGSWTVRTAVPGRGLEPDECYVLGERGAKIAPDLAIEVDWTPGGIDKLEVYRGLGVPEVWIWRRGRIETYLLRAERYERAERSALLPGLDLEVLARYLDRRSQTEAVRAFRAWLGETA